MRKNWAMRHRITILVLDGVVPFDLGVATQIFSSARDADGRRLYAIRVCGLGPVRTASGFTVAPARARNRPSIMIVSSFSRPERTIRRPR